VSGAVDNAATDAGRLHDALQLRAISLIELKANFVSAGGPSPLSVSVDLHPVQWDRHEQVCRSVFLVRVMVYQAPEGKAPIEFVQMQVGYLCVYGILREVTSEEEELVPQFLKTAGWAHAWPYLRAEVQSIAMKLGLPPLVLPVLLPGQAEHVPVQRLGTVTDPPVLEDAHADR
jgi:hypothetical protein